VYFTVPTRFRNLVLFLVSLFFYGWGEPVYVLLMLFSICFNFLFGRQIAKYRDSNRDKAKQYLILDIVLNIGILSFFKYYDFLIMNLNGIGLSFLKPLNLELPIGISFYTFQTMSYPIDLYRHDTDPQKKFINFGAYVTMFPQLIAGPIVRYRDIADMLDNRRENTAQFASGVSRFTVGLCKKVLLANSAGTVWKFVTALAPSQTSTVTSWLGILFYAFQIYFDFSGYSDMAIGLGRMFGFEFLENFNYPYISQSITDFWRRWHMSLSYWFRDYVYIPLGGNRKGLQRQILNIMIVWLLTGFWHGASWNFVLWGVFYGIVLIIEKVFLLKYLSKAPAWVCHIYTMFLVLLAWVLFAFTDLSEAVQYFGMLFGSTGSFFNQTALFILRDHGALLLLCIIASTPIAKTKWNLFRHTKMQYVQPAVIACAILLCTAFIVDATYNPFLYFRF
jgi:alginate O-acetyltransferase complex protein AlgI